MTVTPLVAINFFVDKPRHALRRLLTTRSESDTPLAATTLPHEYLGAPKYANEAKIAVGTIYCSIYYRTMLCISADYAVRRCYNNIRFGSDKAAQYDRKSESPSKCQNAAAV